MMCSHAVIDSNVGQSVMLRAMRKVGQGGGEGVHESNLNPNCNHVFQTSIKRAFSDGHEIYDVILEAGPAWRNQHAMIFHDLKRTPSFFSAFRF